jgi:alpha-1,3-mannosylglycoprotein beta-1,4-N-acetylglucosaminyltransferase A/B
MQCHGFCSSYLFRSGNAEHPSDRFYNTSVEVLPESSHTSLSKIDYNATSDGYIIIGLYILLTSL